MIHDEYLSIGLTRGLSLELFRHDPPAAYPISAERPAQRALGSLLLAVARGLEAAGRWLRRPVDIPYHGNI